jgi:hypothetical protein
MPALPDFHSKSEEFRHQKPAFYQSAPFVPSSQHKNITGNTTWAAKPQSVIKRQSKKLERLELNNVMKDSGKDMCVPLLHQRLRQLTEWACHVGECMNFPPLDICRGDKVAIFCSGDVERIA